MRILKWLKETGTPVDGLGIQGHDMFQSGGSHPW
jgi:GH35 family endo-1,4-beta-xylanase